MKLIVYSKNGVPVTGITTPATSTDNALVRFDGTTGKAIQDSAATLSDAGTLQTTLIDNTPVGTTTPAAGYFSALREKIGGFFAIFTHGNTVDRTYTLPDYDGTLATRAGTETLTNKTLTSPTISGGTADNMAIGGTTPAAGYFSALREKIGGFFAIFTHANSADRTYTLPNYDATLASIAGTETLTNKTLTSPTVNTPTISGGTIDNTPVGTTTRALGYFSALREYIGGFAAIFTHANSADRTYTLPNFDATIASLAGTETLTNKTLTTPTIASFTNATHAHGSAAGGGQLSASTIFNGGFVPIDYGGSGANLAGTGGNRKILSLFSGDGAFTLRQFGGYEFSPFTVLGADAASITISSIPTGYNRLVLVLLLRSDRAANAVDGVLIKPNNNTTAGTYFNETVTLPSTGAVFQNNLGATATLVNNTVIPAATATAGYFAQIIIEIENYTSTTQYRAYSYRGYLQIADTAGNLFPFSGGGTFKDNTNAIASFTIAPQSGTNFKAGSASALYLY